MAISRLKLTHFTAFQSAEVEFGSLNVFHGENSTGKTHLLKLAYSIASVLAPTPSSNPPDRPTKSSLAGALATKLSAVFRPLKNKVGRLATRIPGRVRANVIASLDDGTLEFSFSTNSDRKVVVTSTPSKWLSQSPIFLPTRELLSVYPGFVSLYETQAIPFSETWKDTCLLLGAPVARGAKKKEIRTLLEPLEKTIGCKAQLEGDRFMLQMSTGARVEADLVAEGFRKLSMVARLIANGSLDDKGYLFWDEPEANLNPRLVRKLAPLLLELAGGGVQVFVATHSLFLMRELELVRKEHQTDVRYIGLHPSDSGVRITQGPTLEDSGDLAALDETVEQAERYLAGAFES